MRTIFAVSADGYFARSTEDDMQWLGSTDKGIFRTTTALNGGIMGISLPTAICMPKELKGRTSFLLSRSKYNHLVWGNLEDFAKAYPEAWLIAGPTLLTKALESGYLDEVVICQSARWAFSIEEELQAEIPLIPDPTPVLDNVTPWIASSADWDFVMRTKIGDVTVVNWRRNKCQTAS